MSGPKPLPSPLFPQPFLAQAPDGLLLLTFLVEGEFSPGPSLACACSLDLSLGHLHHSWLWEHVQSPSCCSSWTEGRACRCRGPEGHSHSPWGPWEWEKFLGVSACALLFTEREEREGNSFMLWSFCLLPHTQPPVMPTEACQGRSMPSLLYFCFVLEGQSQGSGEADVHSVACTG